MTNHRSSHNKEIGGTVICLKDGGFIGFFLGDADTVRHFWLGSTEAKCVISRSDMNITMDDFIFIGNATCTWKGYESEVKPDEPE